MSRDYHVDIAQHAARADAKWVDNLLSHFDIPGVESGRQGTARRVSASGVYHVALVRRLTLDLGLNTARAVSIARQLLAGEVAEPHFPVIVGLELRFDRSVFEHSVDLAIAEAVESVSPARRGRPPVRNQGASQG